MSPPIFRNSASKRRAYERVARNIVGYSSTTCQHHPCATFPSEAPYKHDKHSPFAEQKPQLGSDIYEKQVDSTIIGTRHARHVESTIVSLGLFVMVVANFIELGVLQRSLS